VGGLVLAVAATDYTTSMICPFMSAAVLAIILLWVGQHMPVKTRKGAEAAALSKAFKNYLTNLEKYAKPEEVTEQFDKYLPFAIAFGLERTWINRFSRIPATPMPGWYYPAGRPFIAGPVGLGLGAAAGHAAASSGSGAGVSAPSLQGMSSGLSGGLQSMSDGLNTMLNSAARTLTSTPPASNTSSGGRSFSGGGGGGFSSGGGSGGGGRGFR